MAYEVVAVALDCENPEKELIIYKSLYETSEHPLGTIWAREKNNFLEEITRDGRTFFRFEEIEK